MWECAEEFCDELLGSSSHIGLREILGQSYLSPSMVKRNREAAYESRDDVLIHIDGWHRMVQDYWGRSLTRAKDRIMAFAGVARAFAAEHDVTYLAEAWAELLPYDLLWYAYDSSSSADDDRITKAPRLIEAGSAEAPSWSWLKQPRYENRFLSFGDSEDLGKRIALLVSFERSGEHTNHVSDTWFYDFSGLRIWLRIPTITRSSLEWDTSEYAALGSFRCPSLEAQLVSAANASDSHYNVFSVYYCDGVEYISESPENIVLAPMTGDCRIGSFRSDRTEFIFEGLGLQRGDEQDASTWKRHGYWNARLEMYDYVSKDSVEENEAKALVMRIPGVEIRDFCLV